MWIGIAEGLFSPTGTLIARYPYRIWWLPDLPEHQ